MDDSIELEIEALSKKLHTKIWLIKDAAMRILSFATGNPSTYPHGALFPSLHEGDILPERKPAFEEAQYILAIIRETEFVNLPKYLKGKI